MQITLYEYLKLSVKMQYELIFSEGIYIDCSIEEERRYLLYSIDRFFVEVEYNNQLNKIVNNRAFIQGRILNKYANL